MSGEHGINRCQYMNKMDQSVGLFSFDLFDIRILSFFLLKIID